jgi:hypothetical protein
MAPVYGRTLTSVQKFHEDTHKLQQIEDLASKNALADAWFGTLHGRRGSIQNLQN